eukprot:gb/GEZN01000551.1/.p1 GENE.gb/GEZN01000551.1/~~gb/GEZN01000551.1/.p1  ORF type:complete len:1051 (+),score=191.44 gb/GEZN01000551.1/:36-3188(+)
MGQCPFFNPASEKWAGVEGNLVVLSIVWTLHTMLILPLTYHFWQRRSLQPIIPRLPWMTVVFVLNSIIIMLAVVSNRVMPDRYTCRMSQFQPYLLGAFLGLPYWLRAMVLYFRFRLTRELQAETLKALGSSMSSAGLASPKSSRKLHQKGPAKAKDWRWRWFSRHQYMIRWPFLLGVYLILTFFCLLIPFIAIGLDKVSEKAPSQSTMATARCTLLHPGLYMMVFALFFVVFFLVAYSLKGKKEFFHIKDELLYAAAVSLPLFVLWSILNWFEDKSSFTFGTLLLCFWISGMAFLSTLYPTMLSYHFQRDKESFAKLSDVPHNITDFFAVIASPIGFGLFREFLEGEFSVENLLFFQAVEDFRETALLSLTYHSVGDTGTWRFTESKMEGWVQQKMKTLPIMCRRYCVLRNGRLEFFKRKEDKEPAWRMDLLQGGGVVCIEEKGDTAKPNQFLVMPSRSNQDEFQTLIAINRQGMKKWISVIREVVASLLAQRGSTNNHAGVLLQVHLAASGASQDETGQISIIKTPAFSSSPGSDGFFGVADDEDPYPNRREMLPADPNSVSSPTSASPYSMNSMSPPSSSSGGDFFTPLLAPAKSEETDGSGGEAATAAPSPLFKPTATPYISADKFPSQAVAAAVKAAAEAAANKTIGSRTGTFSMRALSTDADSGEPTSLLRPKLNTPPPPPPPPPPSPPPPSTQVPGAGSDAAFNSESPSPGLGTTESPRTSIASASRQDDEMTSSSHDRHRDSSSVVEVSGGSRGRGANKEQTNPTEQQTNRSLHIQDSSENRAIPVSPIRNENFKREMGEDGSDHSLVVEEDDEVIALTSIPINPRSMLQPLSLGGSGMIQTDVIRPLLTTSLDKQRRVPRAVPLKVSESSKDGAGVEVSVTMSTQINPTFQTRLGTELGQPIKSKEWQAELMLYALEMYTHYIRPDAFAEINISQNPRKALAAILDDGSPSRQDSSDFSPTVTTFISGDDFDGLTQRARDMAKKNAVDLDTLPNLFNDAQEEVTQLMLIDPFPRFVRSDLWRRLEAVKKQAVITNVAVEVHK